MEGEEERYRALHLRRGENNIQIKEYIRFNRSYAQFGTSTIFHVYLIKYTEKNCNI